MTGIHQRTAPTKINRTDWNDLITFLGGTSSDPQIDATKILLAQGGSLLSTWRYASDLTKMDAAKVAGNIAAAQMQTNVLAAIIAAGGINRNDVAAPHHRKAFAAYQSAAQTIPKLTWTKVVIDIEEFDLDNVYDNVTNYRYTPGEAGYYLIGGAAMLYGSEDGKGFHVACYKNSALMKYFSIAYPGAASTFPQGVGSVLLYLTNTDYVELYVYHENSVDKDTSPGQIYVYFWGFEI